MFFEVRCGSLNDFRVLVTFATGRAFKLNKEIYSRCVLAEYTSKSPYQAGKWCEISLDFPVSRTSPRIYITLNEGGKQILAWNERTLFFWRRIDSRHKTFSFNTPIHAAEFVDLSGTVIIIYILSGEVRIHDSNNGTPIIVLPYNFGSIAEVVIDPLSAKVLLRAKGMDNFVPVQIELKSNRYRVSKIAPTSVVIKRYFGSLGLVMWSYIVWENGSRRRLLRTENTNKTICPHPVKHESVVPCLHGHGFAVFDDLPDQTPATGTSILQEALYPDLVYWRSVIAKQEEHHRVWLHEHNHKISPCGNYIAFMGCNRLRHPEHCGHCFSDPSRLGIGDRSQKVPSVWWPYDGRPHSQADGRTDFNFDRYSRLFIFTDVGKEIALHRVTFTNEFVLEYLGVIRLNGFIVSPVIYAESLEKVYFAWYSHNKSLEIWRLERGNSRRIRRYNSCVISADIQSPTLVFVNSSGWIGSLIVNSSGIEEIRHHFWLPSELSLPRGDGRDQCNLRCNESGVVSIRDTYGERWVFSVESIGQVLQGID